MLFSIARKSTTSCFGIYYLVKEKNDSESKKIYSIARAWEFIKLNIHAVILLTIQVNLLHLPTSANFQQDIISHIQVAHRLQVRSMHNLIRVWFLNSFQLPGCLRHTISILYFVLIYCAFWCCFIRNFSAVLCYLIPNGTK